MANQTKENPIEQSANRIRESLKGELSKLEAARLNIEASSKKTDLSAVEVEALLATTAYFRQQNETIETIAQSLLDAFNLCALQYTDSREAIDFYNKIKWLFSSKAALAWFVIAATALIKFLYSSGVIPK